MNVSVVLCRDGSIVGPVCGGLSAPICQVDRHFAASCA